MKIYEKVVISMDTLEVVEEQAYEYDGVVAKCKGGGSSTTNTQDKEYNKRMATIAEAQQAMAEEYMDYWRESYKPFETAQTAAQMSLLPGETALAKESVDAQRQLIGLQMPVAKEYYNQTLQGVNVQDEIGKAKSTVAQQFSQGEGQWRREAGRMGIDPNSGRYASIRGRMLRDQAKATAGAANQARRYAENINYERLKGAVTQ